jgi:hypothetical protein
MGRQDAPLVAASSASAPVETAADREKRTKTVPKKPKPMEDTKIRIAASQVVDAEQVKKCSQKQARVKNYEPSVHNFVYPCGRIVQSLYG